MSDLFKHTYYGKKALQNQLLNSIVGNHDLICGCEDPLKHISILIFEKAKPKNFTENQKKIIKQCLGEEDADGGDQKDGEDITGEDLERLFAEDTTADG